MVGAVIVVALAPHCAIAQGSADRTVDQYTCKEIMSQGGTSRDTAIAFLHGFMLGKSGGSSFNLETLAKQTDSFIDYCLDHPTEKAVDAMAKIKG